jgi:hypothetical protein
MTQIDTPDKDVLLAMAIATGRTACAAAEELGLSRSTVQRRMTEPSFRRLINDLRQEMVASALGCISDNMKRGAEAITSLLDSPEPHIKLRAARALFSYGLKLRDSVDIGERMRELENELARRLGTEI